MKVINTSQWLNQQPGVGQKSIPGPHISGSVIAQCNCSCFICFIYNRKLVKFTKVETRDYDIHNVDTNICLNIKNEVNYCSLYKL